MSDTQGQSTRLDEQITTAEAKTSGETTVSATGLVNGQRRLIGTQVSMPIRVTIISEMTARADAKLVQAERKR